MDPDNQQACEHGFGGKHQDLPVNAPIQAREYNLASQTYAYGLPQDVLLHAPIPRYPPSTLFINVEDLEYSSPDLPIQPTLVFSNESSAIEKSGPNDSSNFWRDNLFNPALSVESTLSINIGDLEHPLPDLPTQPTLALFNKSNAMGMSGTHDSTTFGQDNLPIPPLSVTPFLNVGDLVEHPLPDLSIQPTIALSNESSPVEKSGPNNSSNFWRDNLFNPALSVESTLSINIGDLEHPLPDRPIQSTLALFNESNAMGMSGPHDSTTFGQDDLPIPPLSVTPFLNVGDLVEHPLPDLSIQPTIALSNESSPVEKSGPNDNSNFWQDNLFNPALSIEPPVFQAITRHETNRHYLESLEQYIVFLHAQMSYIGAQPLPIDRFSTNIGLRARSIRTLLVYMENVMAEVSKQVQTQEQRFRALQNLF
ncbi:uncharacterized protein C8R40DRAFT_1068352 [Lentinula edodes]|uniref:uncharacterized protein n=1 Tax=Lentinula edodes TaxID=5353 RepID=UPI001E8D801E|nr:uncharacterized protein C8R40DRAFT_1068352 [Lentinula edodes]KAH7876541.1 hypothetical protein C8R40DRAFT_1068352 [Lentinula edodes]